MDIGRGLLGGLAGLGKGMAAIGEEQSKYRMEELKAKTLYDREANLATLKAGSAMGVAKFTAGEKEKQITQMAGEARKTQEASFTTQEAATRRQKMEKGKAIASQVVPNFDEMGKEEQMGAIERVLNQLEASTVLGGEGPSNKDINDATKNANSAWEVMSEDERDAFAKKNNVSVNEARGKYVSNAVDQLKRKGGWDYTKTPSESQLFNLKVEMKMTDNIVRAGSRDEAIKLYNKEKKPKIKTALMKIINDIYPEKRKKKTVDTRGAAFMEATLPDSGAGSEFLRRETSRPTALEGAQELIRGTKPGSAVTAPLKGLLEQGLQTGA